MELKLIFTFGLVCFGVFGCALLGSREPVSPMQVGLGVLQNTSPVGEITKDVSVRQTFEAPQEGLAGISLFMATYGRQNDSNLTINIYQADGAKVLKTYTIGASKLINNSWLLLTFEAVNRSKGKAFWIDIKGNGESGRSPTVWMNAGSTFAESRGKFFVNGKERAGSLCFQVYFAMM